MTMQADDTQDHREDEFLSPADVHNYLRGIVPSLRAMAASVGDHQSVAILDELVMHLKTAHPIGNAGRRVRH